MTAPRQVLPGATYLVTRRCTQRQFLLRPGRLVNEVFLYLLALGAKRYGVRVHAYCVLSNHYHLLVTDPGARLPAFCQYLDGLVARALNALRGRWESLWAPDSYSAVSLATPQDIIDKAVYVLANPVAAGLVRSGRAWPGLWSGPELVGTTVTAARPTHFFSSEGALPESVALHLTAPPGFASVKAFRDALANALAEREASERSGRSFLGVARVLKQRPTGQPAPGEPRRALNPRVAARDKWKRVEMLGRLTGFLVAYREAWEARRAGKHGVAFPFGTYLLRVLHGVPCTACG
ncbi:MAG: transposase [Deltaproteobacteria bacterium]|nr:transposase [Deltaproteobacteria bacterium]